jgi:hypothetical protein
LLLKLLKDCSCKQNTHKLDGWTTKGGKRSFFGIVAHFATTAGVVHDLPISLPQLGWLVGLADSYTVSAAKMQLCPDARRGRQPTRCKCDSAPPHFTLERALCPQRPAVVWLLSTTMYISSPEVTSFACVCVLRTMFPCICRARSLVCTALFKARKGTVASCFASMIPSVSP